MNRRTLLKAGASLAAVGLGVPFYTWRVEPHWLEIVRVPMPIPDLPVELEGKRLVQLSDIHVGPVDDEYVREVFRRVSDLAADFVVYTGDFTTQHADVFAHAAAMYATAPRGTLGTAGSFGNHDWGRGWIQAPVAARFAELFASMGIPILRNASLEMGGLRVCGMDDIWAGAFQPERALPGARPHLVLSHNPDTVDLPGWDAYRGWVLSGHTHGGQVKPPFLDPPILPVKNKRYTAGVFDVGSGRTLYVNRGVGHLTRVRFNVRPEVTLFELRRATI